MEFQPRNDQKLKKGSIASLQPCFLKMYLSVLTIVTRFPKTVAQFPKIYDKLYDKKVLGKLIGEYDPVSLKCDLVS